MTPWTRREFIAAMRAAGWTKQPGPGDGWRHESGARFEGQNWDARNGCENWQAWAARRETPPPF